MVFTEPPWDPWRLSCALGSARSACLVAGVLVVAELVLDRAEHAERGVPPLTVVEDLKVLEDRVGELETGVPSLAVEELDLHPRPERFHLAVVVAVTDRAHGLGQARVQRPARERPGGELTGCRGRSE